MKALTKIITDPLTKIITDRLAEKPSSTVFETDLKRAFPVEGKEEEKRYGKIREYAQKIGCSVSIMNPGVRCTFRKLKE